MFSPPWTFGEQLLRLSKENKKMQTTGYSNRRPEVEEALALVLRLRFSSWTMMTQRQFIFPPCNLSSFSTFQEFSQNATGGKKCGIPALSAGDILNIFRLSSYKNMDHLAKLASTKRLPLLRSRFPLTDTNGL